MKIMDFWFLSLLRCHGPWIRSRELLPLIHGGESLLLCDLSHGYIFTLCFLVIHDRYSSNPVPDFFYISLSGLYLTDLFLWFYFRCKTRGFLMFLIGCGGMCIRLLSIVSAYSINFNNLLPSQQVISLDFMMRFDPF